MTTFQIGDRVRINSTGDAFNRQTGIVREIWHVSKWPYRVALDNGGEVGVYTAAELVLVERAS